MSPRAPGLARCDFCGRAFKPFSWDCRTCVKCAAAGWPDQAGPNYEDRLKAFLAEEMALSGNGVCGRRLVIERRGGRP